MNTQEDDATDSRCEADFYLENGLVVFTAAYLRRRGYCCESGCRHCPYESPARADSGET